MEAWLSGIWGVAQYLFAAGKAGEPGKTGTSQSAQVRSDQFSGFVDNDIRCHDAIDQTQCHCLLSTKRPPGK